MFEKLDEIISYYVSAESNKHQVIYNAFANNVPPDIKQCFDSGDGFGEIAFVWSWKLLVDTMPKNFKFLEIGVFKGRVMALINILAERINKPCYLYGITPLDQTGDKYSRYPAINYNNAIEANFAKMNASLENIGILKGLSTDVDIQRQAANYGSYDMIYIDGCHDYEVVCNDISAYVPMLKKGGYLIMDDASLLLENPYGQFLGHADVCRAIKEKIENNTGLTHLYAVGHNRVWVKN